MEGACAGRPDALNLTIRTGDEQDRDFIRDLGTRVAMTSVSPFRAAIGSLVTLSYERLLDFVYAQSHVALIAEDGGARLGFLLLSGLYVILLLVTIVKHFME